MENRPAEIKGTLDGLYFRLKDAVPFESIVSAVKDALESKVEFYKGARIVGITGRQLSYAEKAVLEEIVRAYDALELVSLEAIDPGHKPRRNAAKREASAEPSEQRDSKPSKSIDRSVERPAYRSPRERDEGSDGPRELPTHFEYGTLRSGKSVEFRGHVVVVGDVNPGSEVVAKGNIIVLGRVLGFVHAGASGNEKAEIIANLLKPTQIRIADHISIPPSGDEPVATLVPERAFVSAEGIKIQKCH